MYNKIRHTKLHQLFSHYYLDYKGLHNSAFHEEIYRFRDFCVTVQGSYGNEVWAITPPNDSRLAEVTTIRDGLALYRRHRQLEFKKVSASGNRDPGYIIGKVLALLPLEPTVNIKVDNIVGHASYVVYFTWDNRAPVTVGFTYSTFKFITRSPCLYPILDKSYNQHFKPDRKRTCTVGFPGADTIR